MAEADQKKEEKKPIFPFLNPFKHFVRSLPLPNDWKPHYTKTRGYPITEIPTYKELQKEINFETLRSMNEEMVLAENLWDGGPKVSTSAADLKKAAIELYKEMGPFFDFDATAQEMKFVDEGTKLGKAKMEITPKGLNGETLIFTIPQEEEVRFKHGLSYNLAFFGTKNSSYWGNLQNEINSFCDGVEQELLAKKSEILQKI